jgi:hypothetical protein
MGQKSEEDLEEAIGRMRSEQINKWQAPWLLLDDSKTFM